MSCFDNIKRASTPEGFACLPASQPAGSCSSPGVEISLARSISRQNVCDALSGLFMPRLHLLPTRIVCRLAEAEPLGLLEPKPISVRTEYPTQKKSAILLSDSLQNLTNSRLFSFRNDRDVNKEREKQQQQPVVAAGKQLCCGRSVMRLDFSTQRMWGQQRRNFGEDFHRLPRLSFSSRKLLFL